jgi:hypothetical protein
MTVSLAANAGASPAGTYYTVVYQLNGGSVATQYWLVGTASPTTIAAVTTTPGTGGPSQVASQQWVNGVLTGKATDSAVVHNTGAEMIAGTKTFAVNPSVPAPVGATDAANKAYVDTAVASVANGNYLQRTGDTMTGTLTLSGDPSAPLQAATRRYVDNGLSAKANLVNGLVPANQLGTGSANGSTCLNGNSSWGPCGTSSNAVQLQGIPLSMAMPSDGQVITYDSGSGSYVPKASASGSGGATAGTTAVKYATDFAWSQTATADLSTPGQKTVTLGSCPAGVTGTEPWYYVYIAGTGTPEAVKVTGGTCAGDLGTGTLVVTTAHGHEAGYTVGSASGGLQEALIAARFTPSNPNGTSQAGKVIAPPGEIKLYARVSVRASDQTVDFSGSIFECGMADSCIYVGDPANSNLFGDITLINPRGRPMVASGTYPMIEVNAQKTRLVNVATRSSSQGTFGAYVQVDDDQSFLLDGLDTSIGYGVRCDAAFCGSAVTAPGPFNTWSAVGWLKNLNISPQCSMNGVDWHSRNPL